MTKICKGARQRWPGATPVDHSSVPGRRIITHRPDSIGMAAPGNRCSPCSRTSKIYHGEVRFTRGNLGLRQASSCLPPGQARRRILRAVPCLDPMMPRCLIPLPIASTSRRSEVFFPFHPDLPSSKTPSSGPASRSCLSRFHRDMWLLPRCVLCASAVGPNPSSDSIAEPVRQRGRSCAPLARTRRP